MSMKKLVIYSVSLIVFFASLEIFVRANHDYFYALSDKLLLKMEILKKRPNNDLVVFGSSRTLDGFDAPAFHKVLNEKYDLNVKTFNAGSTGQNINRYLYSLEHFLKNKDIKVIVIESSDVSMREGSLRINLSKESSQPERSEGEESEASVEGTLQNFMVNNFYTVKVRKSFKPKAFFRLAMIWTSDRFNHDTWFRSGALKQLFTGFYKEYSEEEVNKYNPVVIDETTENTGTSVNSSFEKIIALLKNTDKKVIFYNPDERTKNSLLRLLLWRLP